MRRTVRKIVSPVLLFVQLSYYAGSLYLYQRVTRYDKETATLAKFRYT